LNTHGARIRLRVYGTLGNPDFVAGLTAIPIPLASGLAAAPARRWHTRESPRKTRETPNKTPNKTIDASWVPA
jgi:hypothetical protein